MSRKTGRLPADLLQKHGRQRCAYIGFAADKWNKSYFSLSPGIAVTPPCSDKSHYAIRKENREATRLSDHTLIFSHGATVSRFKHRYTDQRGLQVIVGSWGPGQPAISSILAARNSPPPQSLRQVGGLFEPLLSHWFFAGISAGTSSKKGVHVWWKALRCRQKKLPFV